MPLILDAGLIPNLGIFSSEYETRTKTIDQFSNEKILIYTTPTKPNKAIIHKSENRKLESLTKTKQDIIVTSATPKSNLHKTLNMDNKYLLIKKKSFFTD